MADGRGGRRRRRRRASSSRPASSTSTPTCASRATRTPRRSRPARRGGPRRVHDVCAMPNTTPALDEPGVLAQVRAAAVGLRVAGASCWPTARSRPGGQGRRWRRSASWRTRASSASPTTGRRSGRRPILRAALAYAGALGLPIVDHAEDAVADRRRRGERRVRRDRAGPARLAGGGRGDGGRARPGRPRRRRARRAGRPAAPDPRLDGRCARPRPARQGGRPAGHLRRHAASPGADRRVGRRGPALGVGGERRPVGGRGASSRRPYASSLRVNPPLRAPEDAAACLAALLDGTADAVATDHAPHTERRQGGRVRAGGERDQRHRDGAGRRSSPRSTPDRLPLARAIEALTTGPAAVLGDRSRRGDGRIDGRSDSSRVLRPTSSCSIAPPVDGQRRDARVTRQEHAVARHGPRRSRPVHLRGGPAGLSRRARTDLERSRPGALDVLRAGRSRSSGRSGPAARRCSGSAGSGSWWPTSTARRPPA